MRFVDEDKRGTGRNALRVGALFLDLYRES